MSSVCWKDAAAVERWRRWLTLPPLAVYKADRRSRVWRVEDPACAGSSQGQAVVIKRFAYTHWRQRLAWVAGAHPAWREWRQAARMRGDGLAVVEVLAVTYVTGAGWAAWCQARPALPPSMTLAMGDQPVDPATLAGPGGCVATPWVGPSLLHVLRGGAPLPAGVSRAALLAQAAGLVADLLAAGWVFRDLRTANIVVDAQGRLGLIDVGSARKVRPWRPGAAPARAWRTARVFDHELQRDGLDEADRRACLGRALACLSPLPTPAAYDRLRQIVLK